MKLCTLHRKSIIWGIAGLLVLTAVLSVSNRTEHSAPFYSLIIQGLFTYYIIYILYAVIFIYALRNKKYPALAAAFVVLLDFSVIIMRPTLSYADYSSLHMALLFIGMPAVCLFAGVYHFVKKDFILSTILFITGLLGVFISLDQF